MAAGEGADMRPSLLAFLGLLALPAAAAPAPAATGTASPTAAAAPAAPATLQVQLDHGSITLGESVRYTWTITASRGVEVNLPLLSDDLADIPIVDRGHAPPQALDNAGSRRLVHWLILKPAGVGTFIIPPQELTWQRHQHDRGTLSTPEVFLEVRGSAAVATGPDIRPLKPLWDLSWLPTWAKVALGLLALAAVAALAWFLVRRRRRRLRQAPPLPTADAVALALLAQLRQREPQDGAAARHHFFSMSTIVRTYVEARFALNATDLTSEEILARLHLGDRLDAAAQAQLRQFIAAGDVVKYAGSVPPVAEIQASLDAAVAFVELTRAPAPEAP